MKFVEQSSDREDPCFQLSEAKGRLGLAMLGAAMPDENEFGDALIAFLINGVDGLDPYIAKHRTHALDWAAEGDLSELADLVRKGRVLNQKEREYLLDKKASPRGGKKNIELRIDISKAYFWLNEVDGTRYEPAVSELQSLFRRSRSNVTKHISAGKTCPLTQGLLSYRRMMVEYLPKEILIKVRVLDLKSW